MTPEERALLLALAEWVRWQKFTPEYEPVRQAYLALEAACPAEPRERDGHGPHRAKALAEAVKRLAAPNGTLSIDRDWTDSMRGPGMRATLHDAADELWRVGERLEEAEAALREGGEERDDARRQRNEWARVADELSALIGMEPCATPPLPDWYLKAARSRMASLGADAAAAARLRAMPDSGACQGAALAAYMRRAEVPMSYPAMGEALRSAIIAAEAGA